MPRPIAFEPEEKLHTAMLLFWRKGYAATSLADLVAGLGINRFSIYNTFGDKRTLFQQALQRYRRQVFEASIEPLQAPARGLVCLRDYLDTLGERLLTPGFGELGCLLQNTALEGGAVDALARDYVRETLGQLQAGLAAVLAAARERGQLPADYDIDAGAAFLLAQVQGMVMARKVVGAEAMQQARAFMLWQIDCWEAAGRCNGSESEA
ncbi:TetR/AcrR family transcriptional regulator [Exilibacterium tricleocarpae]|uniref:TetR/AcrR family transcriptional regulator n=1 Tax=Exilibacterium tricleocarpae TaxID=2591008 RepID=A0A545SMV4_9GAMM|nr:TetR/AcrR family transcriptional regulator [Exilibacterium tricleocarpae]TQV66287.1 TetR/AcrR family transcriptional regulator [Exilibacterium tricleocarpae]